MKDYPFLVSLKDLETAKKAGDNLLYDDLIRHFTIQGARKNLGIDPLKTYSYVLYDKR